MISSVYMYTVTLIDETGQCIFNIGVERHEALPIIAALHNLTLPRPQTINAMVDTLKLHGVILEEVRIERVSLSPIYLFSTVLRWRNSDKSETVQELDMRPGDALGLALLMDCPIFLSDELARGFIQLAEGQTPELYMINDLLKREGITLPEGKKLRLGFSKAPMRDALVREFKAALLGKAPPFPEEDMEQRKKDFLAFLLKEST
ncbi:MAG: bifunctional nuclease family protein [Chloroflexi bacterium]|nr:bifunctional nuclease family protein [Chloroflexota bacterium]